MKTLRLGFCTDGSRSPKADYQLNFEIFDHPMAQKWAKRLASCLRKKLFFEKNFSLLGLPGAGRTTEQIDEELGIHLARLSQNPKIKNQMTQMGLQLPLPAQLGQHEMNIVHHLFEILIGQVWAPAELYLGLSASDRHSVRQLNHLVHEHEALMKAQFEIDKHRVPNASLIVPLLKSKRQTLTVEDAKHLNFERYFGDVFLHYAQLGKTHLEAFVDQDEEIFTENISGLRYMTGEFDIHLGEDIGATKAKAIEADLHAWLIQKGFDPKDPRLALGHGKVASLVPGQGSKTEILDQLKKFPNLISIEVIHSNGDNFKSTYPYLRSESERFVQKIFSDSRLERLNYKTEMFMRRMELR